MSKSVVQRAYLLGSVAALAIVGATTTAQAVETKFGEVQIIFDTTVSFGASMRTADREDEFLPEANGGNVDPRENGVVILPVNNYPTFNAVTTQDETFTNNPDNYDGSPNVDDGRLNFDGGDMIGATFKANHDLQIKYENYTFFARAVGFYDVIMNDHDVGDRSLLVDQALGDVGRNYELLDAFVSADYIIADLPTNFRVGKQVINWGESTFILNGLNVFNPIDVGAFRRPGSEIKEALLPVNAFYTSVSLPFDVSVAGYYALDWEPYELDPSGTPFSGADVVTLGSGFGGNVDRGSIVTTSPFGGYRRNCVAEAGSGTRFVQTSGLLPDPEIAINGNFRPECDESQFINYSTPYTIGQHEAVRWGLINSLADEGVTSVTQAILGRGDDHFADDQGQFGLRMNYFADWLDGTEFGAYYQNYHSRLPYISIEPSGRPSQVGTFLQSDNTQLADGLTSRALPMLGCTPPGFDFTTIQVVPGDLATADILMPNPAPTGPGDLLILGANGVPDGVDTKRVTFAATSRAVLAGGLAAGGQAAFMQTTAVSDPGGYLAAAQAAYTAQFGGALFNAGGSTGVNNMFAMAQLNCALSYHQSGIVNAPVAGFLPQIGNGAEQLSPNGDGLLVVDYPEDIDIWGFSFNTTVWGWGVQGEFSYRPDAPFQIDTDSITIASIVKGCTFNALFGAAGPVVAGLATQDGSGASPICGDTSRTNGVLKNEMYTAQIGTTSTYTGSDWIVDFLAADNAVLVTEIGMAFVPNVEDTWLDKYDADGAYGATFTSTYRGAQYQNLGCQGSDLPAGGILGLDQKSSKQCRPTDFSAGLVLLYRMEYNNAFDTGFSIAPQLVYAWDFEGSTPAPYGNFLEDRQAIGFGVTGTLNNNFRIGANYSAFFGGHILNKAKDQDFTSISASYTF